MIQSLERIDGTVLSVHYINEEFTVAQLRQFGGQELTIVGDLAAIVEGQALSLYGQCRQHPRHGPQFRVSYFHTYLAQSREGIRAFLQEEVQGIGPAFAERLVSYFYPLYGAQMLERLQEEPQRLQEMPGLGAQRSQAIVAALNEHYGTRYLLMRFHEVGLAPALARQVIRTYEAKGLDPVRVLRETPYQLLQDLPTLPFERVDRLARQLGLPIDDEGRLQGAIIHVLRRAYYRDGHLFLPGEPLLTGVGELLWQAEPSAAQGERIGDALAVLRNQRYLQIVTVGEQLAFYTRESWVEESGVARHLARLLEAPPPPLPISSPDAAEARSALTLDPTQRRAFVQAMQQGIAIITGGPGTGKSTLARLIVDSWEEAGLRVKLAAPTGRAARRLSETTGREATTVHRLLEWREGEFQRHEGEPLEAEALLVDESSMLDTPLAHALCRAISNGCRLLFMGDVDQLPSVGPGNVLHELIESGCFPVARLTQIHRQDVQQENLIVNLAHAINHAPPGQPIPGGPPVARHPAEGNVFLFDSRLPWARCSCGGVRLPTQCPSCEGGHVLAPLPADACGAELIQQLVLERIPQTFGVASDEIQLIAPRYGGPLGVDELNERLRAALNPARTDRPEFSWGKRTFRLGDRIMAIRNQYDKEVVNGLQGVIVDLEPGNKRLSACFDGEIHASFRGEELDDLTHAYAITAHKAQGGEFPVVLLALDPGAGPLLYRQLFYTAITRARQLLILVGDPRTLARATANDRPRHRWSGLAWWLQQGLE